MAELNIDRVDSLSCTESLGVVRSLTRKARIIFDANFERKFDYDVLGAALALLDNNGYTLFSFLNPNVIGSLNRYASLTLCKRSPSLAENDPCCVDVVLEYNHVMDGPYQILENPPCGKLFVKLRASVSEKSTNFYYPYGDDVQYDKRQILVSHKFPNWETGIAATPFDPTFPRTIFQGGEISIPFPNSNMRLEGLMLTDDPQGIVDDLQATVNEKPWMGGDVADWMCSEVTWEPNNPNVAINAGVADPNPQYYKFTFEWQRSFDGWDVTVAFNDPRTGRPPANLEFGNIPSKGETPDILDNYLDTPGPLGPDKPRPAGVWDVPALPRVDYNAYFGATFVGST